MSRPGFKANLSGWKPRLFAQTKSARVELVPSPVIFLTNVFVLGKGSAAPVYTAEQGRAKKYDVAK